ncbi:MAG TPA: GtrA family protein [Tahibacter sp.]|nr:GtrA family protein [Tahibacter sp.]
MRFLLASGIAAAVNFGSRIAFSLLMPYPAAIACAYACGIAVAFALNRLFVFESPTRSAGAQVFWFVVVNVFGLAQTMLVSLVFARWILPAIGLHAHAELVAHAFGVAAPALTSYFLHKRLAFHSGRP